MKPSELMNGEANEVADYLMGATELNLCTLAGALINALVRVSILESDVEHLRREVETLRQGAPATP